MDESKPLDIFLQPSRRLIFISLLFVVICVLLISTLPVNYLYKLPIAVILLIGMIIEFKQKILLISPNSIIRFGCDGAVVDVLGEVSEPRWWYQRRQGDRVYVQLTDRSRVWVDWISLDFGRWPWQFGHTILIARDSVETPCDFQRLKRILRSR